VKSKPFSFKVQFLKRRSEYLWEEDNDWEPSKHTMNQVSHCISAIPRGEQRYELDPSDTVGRL